MAVGKMFDGLAREPINRHALRATFSGTHFKRIGSHNHGTFDNIPPTRPIPPDLASRVGERIGRLEIVGYNHVVNPGGKVKRYWVVRCDCGSYEYRRLKNFNKQRDGTCFKCGHKKQ
jgi:hypothetical protein